MAQKRGRVNRPTHSEQVKVNLTAEQYNDLYDRAEQAGMSVSAYVRRLIDKEIAAVKAMSKTYQGE